MNEISNAVQVFRGIVERAKVDYYTQRNYTFEKPPTIEVQEAVKFYKLWWVRQDGRRDSIFCFIDKSTGEIFKAAGCNSPAKHARGNVLSDTQGREALSSDSVFIRYL